MRTCLTDVILEDGPKTPRQRKWSRVLLKYLPERFKITDDIILAAMLDPSVSKLDIVTQYLTENKVDMLQILQRASEAQGSVESATVSSSSSSDPGEKVNSASCSNSVGARMKLLQRFQQAERLEYKGNSVISEYKDYIQMSQPAVMDAFA
ncbi:hypothetical protein DMENIID0001_042760 [Sergentomyia squamirostris]